MANERNPKTNPDQPMIYQIRIKGQLDRRWIDWFGDVTITLEENGDTADLPGGRSGCTAWLAEKSARFRDAVDLGQSS